MISDRIERETLIEAPREVVWEVITDPVHIADWFSDEADFEPRDGANGSFTWEGHPTQRVRVIRAEPPRTLIYRWLHPENEEPSERNSTQVEFTLTEEGESTRLRLVESGFVAIEFEEERKPEFYDDHVEGWERHAGTLVTYAADVAAAKAE